MSVCLVSNGECQKQTLMVTFGSRGCFLNGSNRNKQFMYSSFIYLKKKLFTLSINKSPHLHHQTSRDFYSC